METKKSKVEVATLPDELVMDIISRLPVKSLCRFKCVSKFFRSFIQDPYLVDQIRLKTPFKWQFETDEELSIYSIDINGVATLMYTYKFGRSTLYFKHRDGLLCYLDDEDGFCLHNITTKETLLLPEWYHNFELYFDPSSQKYKIFGWKRFSDIDILEFQILTVEKCPSWRPVTNTLDIGRSMVDKYLATAVIGKLMWTEKTRIVSFNLASEEFGVIDLPYDVSENVFEYSLFEFEGSLALAEQRHDQEPMFNMWMLKDVPGSNFWVPMRKNITLPFEGTDLGHFYQAPYGWTLYDSHFSSRSGEIIITLSDEEVQYVYFYNPLNSQFRLMPITGMSYFNIKVNNFVENYLSLEELEDSSFEELEDSSSEELEELED